MGKDIMYCKKCGRKVSKDDNFCGYCSNKLKEVCNCWLTNEPYNCGSDKCRGYEVIADRMRMALIKIEEKAKGRKKRRVRNIISRIIKK